MKLLPSLPKLSLRAVHQSVCACFVRWTFTATVVVATAVMAESIVAGEPLPVGVPAAAQGQDNRHWQFPAASQSAPHLVIQPPQPVKHNRHNDPRSVPTTVPIHRETVGGGYWNQPEDLQTIPADNQALMDDGYVQPGPSTSSTDKHIDLGHMLPSNPNKTPASPAIPQANRMTGWKQPYSYGHFGAVHNRQWSLHRGHQNSHLQWTYR